jgi:type I restriction enzyme S subunit
MSCKRIGDYIHQVNNRNRDLEVTTLFGVNMSKNFMPSVANTSGVDLSQYKVIQKGQFATNIMHVARDEVLPISLYNSDEPAIVSPAYVTFEVNDENELLPEFLMMQFQRPEFDRRAWTYCDSSVRGGLEWQRFCDIQIPIPDTDEQRKYVSLYSGLLSNQKIYEKSLADLQLICNKYMDLLKTHDNKKQIFELVKLVDIRNSQNSITNLLGINIDKVFMSSKANISETDLSKYKVINKDQFAYSAMQVGRDETVRVVLYSFDEPAIISPAYLVFEVIDIKEVLPEFLMIWFYRPEFNRYGWFISDSSVRASLEWDRFKEIQIPIPDMKIQEAIVTIYHTLETRKRINNQLKTAIKSICPVLMKGVEESMVANTEVTA